MLILGRKAQESIRIGDDIVITICRINHDGSVRLGIEAPKHLSIVRTELLPPPAKPTPDPAPQ